MPYTETDWIEKVSQENWPAARVRNVVKAIKEERVRKYGVYQMPPPNAPAKRMTREDGIQWLANTAKIPLIDFKLTRPVHFLAQYFLGGSSEHNAERDAFIKANTIVYGSSARGMNMPADAECASDWMLGLARKQYLVEHACSCFALDRECYCDHAQEARVAHADLAAAPAPPAPAPAPAPAAAEDVNTYVEGYDAPAPAPPAPPAAEDGGGDYLQRIWDEQVRRAREKNDQARAQSSAPTWIVVPEVDLGIRMPAPVTPPPQQQSATEQTPAAPGAPAPESRSAPRFTPEERAHIDHGHHACPRTRISAGCAPRRGDDADDHLFEPPLPTIAEVAERLMSLRLRVDAHIADQQRKSEDRAALNRLSDRLVSSEMELGLIDDALDHMHAGQQSPANVVGRLAKIIARITAMNL